MSPKSKAQIIREYYEQGYSVAEIAKMMGIRYQHAYNVINAHLKHKAVVVKEHTEEAAVTKELEEEVKRNVLRTIISRITGRRN